MGTIKTTNIEPIADNGTVTLGSSGDTFTLGSGVKQSNLNYPAFEAKSLVDQTGVSDNVVTKVEFDTEVFDTDSMYDTSNYRFTPTVAGKYFIYSAFGIFTDPAYGNFASRIAIYKNGNEHLILNNTNQQSSNFPHKIVLTINSVVDMNGTDDYIEIFARCNASTGTGSFELANDSGVFGAYRIGS